MIKVLITGVAGFVGSNLADKLIKEGGYKVIGIDNLAYGVKEQVRMRLSFTKLILEIIPSIHYSKIPILSFIWQQKTVSAIVNLILLRLPK